MFKQLHINITLADALILIPKYQKTLKSLLSYKEKLLELENTPLNENCSAVILKKLPEKLGDPRKFLIPCGFSKLKYKVLADLQLDATLESINIIDIYNDSYEDYLEYLFAINHLSGNPTFSSNTDLTSPEVINPLSGNTTSSSLDHLLEEFADELALITFPLGNDDLLFDIESDLREIEYFLNHDPTKEMDYILSSDFLPSPEYDSFLYESFSKVDAFPSTNNKDKVFNPGILIHENLFEVTVQVTSDKNVKKISISNASLILDNFNPPLYELPFPQKSSLDFLDFEDSCSWFCSSITRSSHPQLHFENPIS
nr:reverse transcriptase domain-containing protein [Tanacetum cinerariifolium]